ncbi:MAG TPA: hypothetical protein VIL84_09260 [Devosiaceae bacterium]
MSDSAASGEKYLGYSLLGLNLFGRGLPVLAMTSKDAAERFIKMSARGFTPTEVLAIVTYDTAVGYHDSGLPGAIGGGAKGIFVSTFAIGGSLGGGVIGSAAGGFFGIVPGETVGGWAGAAAGDWTWGQLGTAIQSWFNNADITAANYPNLFNVSGIFDPDYGDSALNSPSPRSASLPSLPSR